MSLDTPFYLTGQVGGQPFSLHAEGERVILTGAAGARREVDLVPPPAAPAGGPGAAAEAAGLPPPVCPQGLVPANPSDYLGPADPGTSPLDEALRQAEAAPESEEGGRP